MALQINLDKACAVCLQENKDWTSIFDSAKDGQISIQEQIVKCFPSYEEVKYEYPDKICCNCLEDLNAAYRFHNNCEQTSSLLLRCTVVDATQFEEAKADESINEAANQEELLNQSDSSNEEDGGSNKFQYEDLSELERIDDHDNEEQPENIFIEESTQQYEDNHKEESKVVKNQLKDLALKRFKSKISKINGYKNKSTKNAQTQKNTPKICELCGNSYKYQHALKAHMRRHLNDRPFKCEFCERKFVSNVELRRHMRVHTGQKPYACSYCERCFSDFGSRIKHERTHTGERPFVCETCNKTFAYAHVLTVHMRTHTGEKKFKCSDCGRGFTKKAYLAAHMQQHSQSAEIAAKDKEIQSSLTQPHDLFEISNVAIEKCVAKTFLCSKCREGFSKKSSLMLHMEQCRVKCTANNVGMESLDEPLEDCITTYIIEEELYAENSEQFEQLDEK